MDINQLSTGDINGIRNKDENVVTKIYNSFYKRLYYQLHHYFVNHQDVEEIVNDTFVTAFHKIDQFDQKRSFLPWLVQIGKNLSLNRLRSQTYSFIDDQPINKKMTLIYQESSLGIPNEYFSSLSSSEIDFVKMYYVEGYTMLEIATIKKASLSTIKRQHKVIIDKIRRSRFDEK